MTQSSLHRLAVLLCVLICLLIASGAFLTSEIRPLPGTGPATPVAPFVEQGAGTAKIHSILADIVGLATLGIALMGTPGARRAAWASVGVILVGAALGYQAGPSGTLPVFPGILHALLAPVALALTAAVALYSSDSWNKPAVAAPDLWAPLNRLMIVTPVFIVLQIMLGAAFRHNAMGVISHIMNATITLVLVLVLGICVLRQYPTHPTLRQPAVAFLVITAIQVLLGFATYMMLLVMAENNMALIIISTLHVLTGSLTLAASVVLSLQLQRSARAGLSPASQTGH